MAVVTYEGIVEGGQIRIQGDARLPEHTRVYVVVPDAPDARLPRLASPRLARPEQVEDFRLEVREAPDAGV